MFRSAIDIAGGVAAAVIAVCLGLVLAGVELPAASGSISAYQSSINRDVKADMLPVNPAAAPAAHRISVIEVIGVSDAAVVYRDRNGQLLFKTDPLSNVTVISKNTVLPEITVRDTNAAETEVMPVPVEAKQSSARDEAKQSPVRELPSAAEPAAVQQRIPEGCESAFSPFIVPSQKNKAGRCLSSIDSSRKVSALN